MGWSQGGVPLYINRLKQEFDDRITMFRVENIYIYAERTLQNVYENCYPKKWNLHIREERQLPDR